MVEQARNFAASSGLDVVGYYQATERVDDTALTPVGERVAGKIREGFKEAVAFVVRVIFLIRSKIC